MAAPQSSNNRLQGCMTPVVIVSGDSSSAASFDSIVLVGTGINKDHLCEASGQYLALLQSYQQVDSTIDHDAQLLPIPGSVPNKLVYSPTGPLDEEQFDIRVFSEAAAKGIKRALKSGSKKPLLLLPTAKLGYEYHDLVCLLGAMEALYVPLEIREDVPSKKLKATLLGVQNLRSDRHKINTLAQAIESGRLLCRDIGGSDPERMAPPRVADYVKKMFEGTCVKVDVVQDEATIQREYPLLAAVNRAARGIERHRSRVIFLTYEPEGPVDTTLVLVGKGVTYDTGGSDIKTCGCMYGMHRDKCGAAAVAGFFQVLAELKPKGIKVIGGMSMVRNSVGPDGYVADELITSRAGVRIRVANTDAEGRMAMADVLCHLKEKVVGEANPYLFTIATLTGHACLTVGEGYSIILDNGPSKKEGVSQSIQDAGDAVGDPFEISTIRREDYSFIKGKSEYEDIMQCNTKPSSQTPRGHQFPAAFLVVASGLDKHGLGSSNPLKYSHIDIAASSGPYPGIPSGAPIAALTARFLLHRVS